MRFDTVEKELLMGVYWLRHGEIGEQTVRGGTPYKQPKPINANDDVYLAAAA